MKEGIYQFLTNLFENSIRLEKYCFISPEVTRRTRNQILKKIFLRRRRDRQLEMSPLEEWQSTHTL
jgi:hypothetical protein